MVTRRLGAAAVGGMLIGTLCQVFVVPALFAFFQYLQERVKPLVFEDEASRDVIKELEPVLQRDLQRIIRLKSRH